MLQSNSLRICILVILVILIIVTINILVAPAQSYESFDDTVPTSSSQDIDQRLQELKTYLAKYSNLDIPISVTDNNTVCNPWGIFQNSKYLEHDNVCTVIDNTFARQCLTTEGNVLTPCGKRYSDGVVDNANAVIVDTIYNSAVSNMNSGYSTLSNAMLSINTDLDKQVINTGQYTNIVNSQNTLISNNMVGLTDKKQYYNENVDTMQRKLDKTQIDRINYQQVLLTKNNAESRISLYKKIILGMLIILAILCGLIYIMSNIL